jgi:hypothetical protein
VVWGYQKRRETALELKLDMMLDGMVTEDMDLPKQECLKKTMDLGIFSFSSPLHGLQAIWREKWVGDVVLGGMEGVGLGETGTQGGGIGGGEREGRCGMECERDVLLGGDREEESVKPSDRRMKQATMDTTPFLPHLTYTHSKSMTTSIFHNMGRNDPYGSMFEGADLPPLSDRPQHQMGETQ